MERYTPKEMTYILAVHYEFELEKAGVKFVNPMDGLASAVAGGDITDEQEKALMALPRGQLEEIKSRAAEIEKQSGTTEFM